MNQTQKPQKEILFREFCSYYIQTHNFLWKNVYQIVFFFRNNQLPFGKKQVLIFNP